MTESKLENYSNLPLPFSGSHNNETQPPKIPLIPPTSEGKSLEPAEKMSLSPSIPGSISSQDTQRLENLQSMLERYDNTGSVPTAPIVEEIAQLSAKKEGYSLEEGRFAPGSVMLNLPPVGITEEGFPVYEWVKGATGKRLRGEGVKMLGPDWLKKMAKRNKRISTKNVVW